MAFGLPFESIETMVGEFQREFYDMLSFATFATFAPLRWV
jgi:hypothetical protein